LLPLSQRLVLNRHTRDSIQDRTELNVSCFFKTCPVPLTPPTQPRKCMASSIWYLLSSVSAPLNRKINNRWHTTPRNANAAAAGMHCLIRRVRKGRENGIEVSKFGKRNLVARKSRGTENSIAEMTSGFHDAILLRSQAKTSNISRTICRNHVHNNGD
jgi:hypothetical protein